MSNYFSIGCKKIVKNEVKLAGSASMIRALENDPNAKLIEVQDHRLNGLRIEYVIAELYCDEVPSRNRVGIEYCERIAYLFCDQEKYPCTLALRKNFPITMHQNISQDGSPKELCLYEEPVDVVAASWTAERHVKRTCWWLTKASKADLHADEQQVEALFFNPSSVIVFPHNFGEKHFRDKRLNAFAINNGQEGSEKLCIITKWEDEDIQSTGIPINIVELETPAITHGVVNLSPNHLKDLISLLNPLGVDLIKLIRERLLQTFKLNKRGQEQDKAIFVMKLPIRRADNSLPEKYQTVAFLSLIPFYQLLKMFEVIADVPPLLNIRANGTLRPLSKHDIDFEITFVECIKKTTPENRRIQSGVPQNIKKGVVIGGGALGGALIDLWTKAGWGQWTVVDNDSFRPHNFTRHSMSAWATGFNKAKAIALEYNAHFKGLDIVGLNVDATDFKNPSVQSYLRNSEIVVDASASLGYPRAASTLKHAPRHISVFFSPSGNDAVMLVEDRKRKIRVSSLESQYYRALINHKVGETHLTLKTDEFRSGVSCRDSSVVLSHARVMSCSSLLADQIRYSCYQESAKIRIWQEKLETAERVLIDIPVHKVCTNKNHTLNTFEVFWDKGIESKVKALRENNLPNETGGVLLGYHDMFQKRVFVVDACSAPKDSISTTSSFIRGTEGVVEALLEVGKRTANNVCYIGEWHSHPKGSSAQKSHLDEIQLNELAICLAKDGLPAYQMIVSDNDVKFYEKIFNNN